MQDQTFPPPPPPAAPAYAPPSAPLGPGGAATLSDMRLLGWVSFVYGVLTCLSIVGAVVGVPMIIASRRFLDGVERFEAYRLGAAVGDLQEGFAELGRSFRIMKILVVVYLVLTALYLVFLFTMGGLGLLAGLADA